MEAQGSLKRRLKAHYQAQHEDFWRMYANPHEAHFHHRRLEVIGQMLDKQNLLQGARQVLDVGCGDGYAASQLLNLHPDTLYVGMDLSVAKLQGGISRFRGEKSGGVCADAELSPVKSDAFDLVLCLEMLEHLPNPGVALLEIRRVLRAGGHLVLSVPFDARLQPGLRALVDRVRRLLRKEEFREHLHTFTSRRILRLLDESGFGTVAWCACGVALPLTPILVPMMPYHVYAKVDQYLSCLGVGMFGIGTKLGLSFGANYLIIIARRR